MHKKEIQNKEIINILKDNNMYMYGTETNKIGQKYYHAYIIHLLISGWMAYS